MRRFWFFPLVVALGCSLSEEDKHAGTGTMTGKIEGLSLACTQGVSIARSFPPSTEIKVSPSGVSCETVQDGDRVTIDIGDSKPGTYNVVTGYPAKAKLSAAQARAHACSADESLPCHDLVRDGKVVITRADDALGGLVEGTFDLVLADGNISGTFSAIRCN